MKSRMTGCAVRKYGIKPYFNCKLHGSLVSRSRLAGGGSKPVYAAEIGNYDVVNDTFKRHLQDVRCEYRR